MAPVLPLDEDEDASEAAPLEEPLDDELDEPDDVPLVVVPLLAADAV